MKTWSIWMPAHSPHNKGLEELVVQTKPRWMNISLDNLVEAGCNRDVVTLCVVEYRFSLYLIVQHPTSALSDLLAHLLIFFLVYIKPTSCVFFAKCRKISLVWLDCILFLKNFEPCLITHYGSRLHTNNAAVNNNNNNNSKQQKGRNPDLEIIWNMCNFWTYNDWHWQVKNVSRTFTSR